MSISTALDGIESIIAIIKKGDADPAQKLEVIKDLAQMLRNDIQDLADQTYATYVPALPPITFDMKKAVEDLLVQFRKQEYNNLYAYYTMDMLADEKDPYVRVAFATALGNLAVELKRDPSPVWASLIQTEGLISEADE